MILGNLAETRKGPDNPGAGLSVYVVEMTLAHCRKRIREALSLSVDDAYEAELVDEIIMPEEACEILDNVEKVQCRIKELGS